jgi:hypothetical protein
VGAWTWRHSAAGFGLAIALFLAATGCELSKSNPVAVNTPATGEFRKILAVVQDEQGKRLEGATIKPSGFRKDRQPPVRAEAQRDSTSLELTGMKLAFYEDNLLNNHVTMKFGDSSEKPVTIELTKECHVLFSPTSSARFHVAVESKTFTGGIRVQVQVSGHICLDVTAQEMILEYSWESPTSVTLPDARKAFLFKSNGDTIAEMTIPKGMAFALATKEGGQMNYDVPSERLTAKGGLTIQIDHAGGSPVIVKADEIDGGQ